jgi:hypothetical protein
MAQILKKIVRAVAAPAEVAAGAATDVSDLQSMVAHLLSAGTATYQFQISIDGTNFVNHGSALTASGAVATAIPDCAVKVRWNCTAWTNGTPTSAVGGMKDLSVGGIL